MGKIYGYARVSTPTQRLDRQIKNIEEYCKDKKIEKIYAEKYTGTKIERPQFAAVKDYPPRRHYYIRFC